MLQIHRDVGVAVRQAEVEGGNAVPVGVDGDHKLSLFITNGPTKFHFTAPFHFDHLNPFTAPFHFDHLNPFTAPFHFDHLNPFTALHFHSTHSRCITTSKQIFHINREKSWNLTHSMRQIFNPKQTAALPLTKCYYVTSLTSDSTLFSALDSATQYDHFTKTEFHSQRDYLSLWTLRDKVRTF